MKTSLPDPAPSPPSVKPGALRSTTFPDGSGLIVSATTITLIEAQLPYSVAGWSPTSSPDSQSGSSGK